MEQSIYQPPKSELGQPIERREQLGRILSIIGGIFQLAIVCGFVLFIIKMVHSFQTITLYGEGDPKVMAGYISTALVNVILGSVVAFPGLVLNIVALYISSYRAVWLFRYLIFISIIWILSFPFGTIFGIVSLVIVIAKGKLNRAVSTDE